MREQTESASNHDTLCPARNRPAAWEPEMCVCDVIAKVRADERERVMSEGPYFTNVAHDCCVKLQELRAAVVEMQPRHLLSKESSDE